MLCTTTGAWLATAAAVLVVGALQQSPSANTFLNLTCWRVAWSTSTKPSLSASGEFFTNAGADWGGTTCSASKGSCFLLPLASLKVAVLPRTSILISSELPANSTSRSAASCFSVTSYLSMWKKKSLGVWKEMCVLCRTPFLRSASSHSHIGFCAAEVPDLHTPAGIVNKRSPSSIFENTSYVLAAPSTSYVDTTGQLGSFKPSSRPGILLQSC
mmetsp:Transcript_42213/g.99042  ORF Transcript_42213/g.99042 Transcript_42213/m.99042 type:complete len:214 (+) Transcript_42213:367-1008(+)